MEVRTAQSKVLQVQACHLPTSTTSTAAHKLESFKVSGLTENVSGVSGELRQLREMIVANDDVFALNERKFIIYHLTLERVKSL